MPDETPVGTRPEDGARTDHSSPAVAEPEPAPPPAEANGSSQAGRRAAPVAGSAAGPGPAAPAGSATGAAAAGAGPVAAGTPPSDAATADAAPPTAARGDATRGSGAAAGTAPPGPARAGSTTPGAGTQAVAAPGGGSSEAPADPGPARVAGPAADGVDAPRTAPGGGGTDEPDRGRVGSAAEADGPAGDTGGSDAGRSDPDGADGDAEDAEESTQDSAGSDRRRGSFLRELPVLLVVAFGLALLIKTFLVQAFFIPSGSMERTLHGCTGCSGDRVLVNKLVYRFRDPHPGDIVVFRGPESWAPEAQFAKPSNVFERALRAVGSAIGVAPAGEKDFVKRVIAVGGQTVQCCDEQGRVTVDGRPLNEPYVYLTDQTYRPTPFGPITVPQGRLWMMGDHRDESADSRVHIGDADQGTIGVHDVVGKAFVIVWPPSRWATLGTPSTFTSAAPAGAAVAAPYLLGFVLAVPVTALRRRRGRGAP